MSLKPERILEILAQFQMNALSKSDEEIFREASDLDLKYGREPTYVHNIDGVLINIGIKNKSLRLVYHARKRLSELLRNTKETFPFYNMGNAYEAIAEMKHGNEIKELLSIEEPRRAREYFASVPPGPVFAQAYTNLANILERYGRNYEAIHIYDRVLARTPTFGMALGNKAKALLYYYNLVSKKNPEQIFLAEELLTKSVAETSTVEFGGQEAVESFRAKLRTVKEFISKNNMRRPVPRSRPTNLPSYQRFGMEKNLYLNFCFNCFHCKRGFVDSFPVYFIDRFSAQPEPQDNGLRYSGYTKKTYYSIKALDQIYEDYATARFLYYIASTKKLRNHDRSTEYISALDYTENSLQYGLIKTTYIRLFNILDKIARLVCTNYELKPEYENIYFKDLKSGELGSFILEKKSWSLLALHSLAWDFNEKEIYCRLQQIRNFLTHEYVDISLVDLEERDRFYKEHRLPEDLLYTYTEDLFLLVKSALAYFMNALFQDFRAGRKNSSTPLTLPLHKQKSFF